MHNEITVVTTLMHDERLRLRSRSRSLRWRGSNRKRAIAILRVRQKAGGHSLKTLVQRTVLYESTHTYIHLCIYEASRRTFTYIHTRAWKRELCRQVWVLGFVQAVEMSEKISKSANWKGERVCVRGRAMVLY